MIRVLLKLFSLFLVGAGLAGCATSNEKEGGGQSQDWMRPNGKLKVLSTIAMIDDIVGKVGGDHIDHVMLIKGELDPHSYQLVKGDDEKLAAADIIFYNGLGLEHGPSLQHYLHESAKAIGLGDKIREKEPALILYFRGQLDPHIWMDISMWTRTVPSIVEALSGKDPAHAAEYAENGKKLMEKMRDEHQVIHDEMMAIPPARRYLVTSHDAFNYFTRSYLATPEEAVSGKWQERFVAPEGLAPESQLSATDIQLIIDHMRKYRIHVLFPESNVSRDSIRKIVQAGKENGLDLTIADVYLYADAMGRAGSDGDSYLKMIEHNAKTIAQYLDGKNKGDEKP